MPGYGRTEANMGSLCATTRNVSTGTGNYAKSNSYKVLSSRRAWNTLYLPNEMSHPKETAIGHLNFENPRLHSCRSYCILWHNPHGASNETDQASRNYQDHPRQWNDHLSASLALAYSTVDMDRAAFHRCRSWSRIASCWRQNGRASLESSPLKRSHLRSQQ